MYTRMCAACAEKIGAAYFISEMPGSEIAGFCPQCGRLSTVWLCEVSPRRTRYNRRTGGGERSRAGRG